MAFADHHALPPCNDNLASFGGLQGHGVAVPGGRAGAEGDLEAGAGAPTLPGDPWLSGSPAPLPSLAPARLVELFGSTPDAGAAGFALARIPQRGPVLWVQDRAAARAGGRPFGGGCERLGCAPYRLIVIRARNAADLLWAMEEGLRCRSFAAIVGEVSGNPAALGFVASKRLATRAKVQRVPVFLLRLDAARDLSAAAQRWAVRSLPSAPHPYDPAAPGAPRWHAELFRAREARPGHWVAQYDRAAHRLHLVSALPDGTLAAPPGQDAGSATFAPAAAMGDAARA